MYLIDGLIVVVMTFFFVLPMTGARTARMKLSVAAGGIGCRALRDALTVVARVDCAVVRGWPARERGASA